MDHIMHKRIISAAIAAAAALSATSCVSITPLAYHKVAEDTINLSDISRIDIDMKSTDVRINLGSENKVHYKVYERIEPDIDEKGGVLSVKSDKSMGLAINTTSKDNYVEITLDKDTLDNLDIVLSSGDISIDGISFDGNITTSSGDIAFENISDGGEVRLTTSSGDITAKDCVFRSIGQHGSSGNISFDGVALESLAADVTSGDIALISTDFSDAELDARSGDIKIRLRGEEQSFGFDLSCHSGDIDVSGSNRGKKYNVNSGSGRTVKASTTSGDIDIDFI